MLEIHFYILVAPSVAESSAVITEQLIGIINEQTPCITSRAFTNFQGTLGLIEVLRANYEIIFFMRGALKLECYQCKSASFGPTLLPASLYFTHSELLGFFVAWETREHRKGKHFCTKFTKKRMWIRGQILHCLLTIPTSPQVLYLTQTLLLLSKFLVEHFIEHILLLLKLLK